jgi:hypothetical protein
MTGDKAEIPKPIRRQLNALVSAAHEEAMRRALAGLAADFDRWRRGEIDSFVFTESIHKFHDGSNREIYKQFALRKTSDLPLLAAYSLVQGLIEEKDIPPEVLPYIAGWLKFYREE